MNASKYYSEQAEGNQKQNHKVEKINELQNQNKLTPKLYKQAKHQEDQIQIQVQLKINQIWKDQPYKTNEYLNQANDNHGHNYIHNHNQTLTSLNREQVNQIVSKKQNKQNQEQNQKKIKTHQLSKDQKLQQENQKKLKQSKYKQREIQNQSLELFHESLKKLHAELKKKYLNQNQEVIDRQNWELFEQYQNYFNKSESLEDFQKKYVKLAFQTSTKVQYCNCCIQSNQQLCNCYYFQLGQICDSCRCMICCSWQILMWGTCGIIMLPYYIMQTCCSSDHCESVCYCLFRVNYVYEASYRCQCLALQIFFGCKSFKLSQKFCKSFCSYIPTLCKVCKYCPIATAKNTFLCVKTCFLDYVDCCQMVFCEKKQVIRKLHQIYQEYGKKILQEDKI